MKEKEWLNNYKKVLIYYKENDNISVSSRKEIIIDNQVFKIGAWLIRQRVNYKQGKLSDLQIHLLKNLNFDFTYTNYSDKWCLKFEALKEYKSIHGNLVIPNKYIVTLKSGEQADIGSFINSQKVKYKNGTLSIDKIKKLESIGITWSRIPYTKIYELFVKYSLEHGDLLIPNNYQVTQGDLTINLGQYIHNLRSSYKLGKLSPKQIADLESIGMVWNYKEEVKIKSNWLKMYKEAVLYNISNGDLYMDENYKVIRDGKCLNLGTWLHSQRSLYSKGKLNEEQIALLDEINIEWDMEENRKKASFNRWLKNYEEACKYYYRFGNLFVPSTYTTTSNEKTYKLGVWINSQRKDYRNNIISKEKIELLESIGMVWNYNKECSFIKLEDVINYLTIYKAIHGNIDIDSDYVCNINGKTVNLGIYLTNLKSKYKRGKLFNKTYQILNDLGFDFDSELKRCI